MIHASEHNDDIHARVPRRPHPYACKRDVWEDCRKCYAAGSHTGCSTTEKQTVRHFQVPRRMDMRLVRAAWFQIETLFFDTAGGSGSLSLVSCFNGGEVVRSGSSDFVSLPISLRRRRFWRCAVWTRSSFWLTDAASLNDGRSRACHHASASCRADGSIENFKSFQHGISIVVLSG
jgi:hypothetical protein